MSRCLNDITLFAPQRQTSNQVLRRGIGWWDRLYQEDADKPAW